MMLTLGFPLAGLLAIVAVVGFDTTGTQTLIYGFVANYYRTNVRAAGVARCAGFGRLGGIGGPLLGSTLIGAGFKLDSIFYVLAGLGMLGVMVTLFVPMARAQFPQRAARVERVPAAVASLARAAPQVESARRFKVDIGRWPLIGSIDAACARLAAFRDAAPAAQPDAERARALFSL
ncbi:MAG TPA: hypothetical protein VH041_14720 [Caldimonas sp.]|nr:hypothetical protein [Caldimonas sp.]HEX4235546.1 hypothetical protein [Caldimonas sp.]